MSFGLSFAYSIGNINIVELCSVVRGVYRGQGWLLDPSRSGRAPAKVVFHGSVDGWDLPV